MKTLSEYIKECDNICAEHGMKAYYDVERLKEFYGHDNFVPMEFDKSIMENLKTHDADKLKKKIKEAFSYVEFKEYAGTSEIHSFYIISKNPISDENKLNNILEFFNYFVSQKRTIDGMYTYFIEPRFSEDVSDKVFNNHYYLYHFTNKKNVDSIIDNGLRCRTKSYRKYPDRIYIYASKVKTIDTKAKKFALLVTGCNSFDDVAMFRIRNDGNITYYSDTAMKEQEAIFTYTNIPKSMIKRII